MPIIDNVACEAFAGLGLQVLVTAQTKPLVQAAVNGFTALPSVIVGGAEGGIGQSPQNYSNPGHRPGTLCQLWVAGTDEKAQGKLQKNFAFRVRQALMTTPTVAVFDMLESESKFDVTESIGHYGDGFESNVEQYGRQLLSVPLMMGHNFLIDREISYKEGVMGGFLWLYCDSIEHALAIAQKAIDTAQKVKDVSTILGICPSGSKLKGTRFPNYGPTTNHVLCPTLRETISDSEVPPGVSSIPEIVVNAFDLVTLKQALKTIIDSIQGEEGLIRVSSRSFSKQLGNYSISLRDL